MNSKKKLLKKSCLYAIIDKKISGSRSISNIANKIKKSQALVDIIQYRDKESKKETIIKNAQGLRKLLLNSKAIFIINDYLDIAKIVRCDGVHLGQGDIPIETARRILGKDKIIGLSCHNLKQAIKAQTKGADYISIGPIFPTPTKPEYKAVGLSEIKKIKEEIGIPAFAIGGINENNLKEVLLQGIERIAVCRAVCEAKNIPKAVKKLRIGLKR